MGTSNIEISILKKRLELLEMKIGELNSINPEILNERLAKIEERLYVVKEMLTTEEASKYLGISQSQIYKLTMNMQIPHFKPKGKTIYFNGFFQQFFFGWCHVVWVVIIRHKLAVFNPQNAIHWLFTKGANLMDRHADFINRFDAIIFRQAGEKLG